MSEEKSIPVKAKAAKISLDDLEAMNSLGAAPDEQQKKAPAPPPYKDTEDEEPEKKSAKVRMFDEFGKKRGTRIAELANLSEEMLPPITKRKVARYEVLGKDKIDPLTGKFIDPVPPCILPGTFIVYDPFDPNVTARHKLLKYVTRSETVIQNGMPIVKEYIDDIIIDDGFKSVNIEKDYLLYVMLELHPLNASNRRRPQTDIAPAFRRVDVDRRLWDESVAIMDLKLDAENSVVKETNRDTIIRWAHAAGIHTQNRMIDGESGVKYDLRVFARNNPREFFQLNKQNTMAIKINVLDAFNLGLIVYNADTRLWTFSTDGSNIGRHLPGEEPTDALIKLFAKPEYSETYQRLVAQLDYWA